MYDVEVRAVDALDGQRYLNFVLTTTVVDLRRVHIMIRCYDEWIIYFSLLSQQGNLISYSESVLS